MRRSNEIPHHPGGFKMKKAKPPIFDKWDFPDRLEDYNITQAIRTTQLQIADMLYLEGKRNRTSAKIFGKDESYSMAYFRHLSGSVLYFYANQIVMLAIYGGEL